MVSGGEYDMLTVEGGSRRTPALFPLHRVDGHRWNTTGRMDPQNAADFFFAGIPVCYRSPIHPVPAE
jgi:hypothetical protein